MNKHSQQSIINTLKLKRKGKKANALQKWRKSENIRPSSSFNLLCAITQTWHTNSCFDFKKLTQSTMSWMKLKTIMAEHRDTRSHKRCIHHNHHLHWHSLKVFPPLHFISSPIIAFNKLYHNHSHRHSVWHSMCCIQTINNNVIPFPFHFGLQWN